LNKEQKFVLGATLWEQNMGKDKVAFLKSISTILLNPTLILKLLFRIPKTNMSAFQS
jgi:hypothetical protein